MIDWIIDRHQVKTDKASDSVNDPNDWSDDPRYIVDLVARIVRVSIESADIIKALPSLSAESASNQRVWAFFSMPASSFLSSPRRPASATSNASPGNNHGVMRRARGSSFMLRRTKKNHPEPSTRTC